MKATVKNCKYNKCRRPFITRGKYCSPKCQDEDFNILKKIRRTNIRNNERLEE